MKKNDFTVIAVVAAILAIFKFVPGVYEFYLNFNSAHGFITSFIKFAILATFGEAIGLRIKSGVYNQKGFGLIPRAIVWGFLGLGIKAAFIIFASGVPNFLAKLGVKDAALALKGDFTGLKLLTAFSISVLLNTIFAPVMMTFHKITDTHIINNGGTVKGFFRPIKFAEIAKDINWDVMMNFVFKKTIPLFWFPAHTITFLLPPDFQVLFAAVLGIVLGVILAIAALKNK